MLGQNREPNFDEYQSDLAEPYDGEEEEEEFVTRIGPNTSVAPGTSGTVEDTTSVRESRTPSVRLSGTDGNVFALLGRCTTALRRAGMREEAEALEQKVFAAQSYDEALQAMMGAVHVS
jgi:hypothetical protein